jgi:hypothetical protein
MENIIVPKKAWAEIHHALLSKFTILAFGKV